MANLNLKPAVKKFIESLPPSHRKRIKNYILALKDNPRPQGVVPIVGYTPYLRGHIEEYYFVYRYDIIEDIITIVLIGKRDGHKVMRII